eukprot:jgi/Chrzof1/12296/Cz06g29080.t1
MVVAMLHNLTSMGVSRNRGATTTQHVVYSGVTRKSARACDTLTRTATVTDDPLPLQCNCVDAYNLSSLPACIASALLYATTNCRGYIRLYESPFLNRRYWT